MLRTRQNKAGRRAHRVSDLTAAWAVVAGGQRGVAAAQDAASAGH